MARDRAASHRQRRLCKFVVPTALAVAACATAGVAVGQGSLKRPAVEDFFRNPLIVDVKLSPDGNHLAMTAFVANGRVVLLVADAAKPLGLQVLASFSDGDVRRFFWVNNRRLVYDGEDLQSDFQTGNGGLYAVDVDGSHFRRLIASDFRFRPEQIGSNIVSSVLPTTYVFYSTLPGESDDVLVEEAVFPSTTLLSDRFHPDHTVLMRLNTRSSEHHGMLERQPHWVTQWLLDPDGEPRIAMSWHEGTQRVYYREKGEANWKLLDEKSEFDPQALQPVFIGSDSSLYVGRDDTVYRVDPKQPPQQGEPFVTHKGFDFDRGFEVDPKERKLLGVHVLTDAHGTQWIEPRLAAAQKAIDAALPGTINTITCGDCLSSRFLLVRTSSDRQPERFLLFDPVANKLAATIGNTRPWIDPKQMGRRDFFRYRARDGMEIPVYLTLPPGWEKDEKLPLIVWVHGGPWVRGASWEWEAEAQFFATRGYAVVEPQFRGSTGFGYAHFHAGWHQWGLAMQDDLADAAQWAVTQGYADPARIAIGGASYGGYATLMGLIKEPQLYRCGFELAGVTDINLMYSISWNDASRKALKYGMRTLIADPDKDAAQLAATSPLKNAQRLTQPLLMAYGMEDVRVPVFHGTEFRDAVSDTNKNVEWLSYAREGHGLRQQDDRLDYWRHVEAFLDRCFGTAANQGTANAPANSTAQGPESSR